MNEAIIALIAALFGGAGLKVIEHYLNRSKHKTDFATQLRSELRSDIKSLRDELRDVENQLDEWKEKYYSIKEELVRLQARYAEQETELEAIATKLLEVHEDLDVLNKSTEERLTKILGQE